MTKIKKLLHKLERAVSPGYSLKQEGIRKNQGELSVSLPDSHVLINTLVHTHRHIVAHPWRENMVHV